MDNGTIITPENAVEIYTIISKRDSHFQSEAHQLCRGFGIKFIDNHDNVMSYENGVIRIKNLHHNNNVWLTAKAVWTVYEKDYSFIAPCSSCNEIPKIATDKLIECECGYCLKVKEKDEESAIEKWNSRRVNREAPLLWTT